MAGDGQFFFSARTPGETRGEGTSCFLSAPDALGSGGSAPPSPTPFDRRAAVPSSPTAPRALPILRWPCDGAADPPPAPRFPSPGPPEPLARVQCKDGGTGWGLFPHPSCAGGDFWFFSCIFRSRVRVTMVIPKGIRVGVRPKGRR